MKSKLDQIESRLQALIENRFTWLGLRGNHPRLARQLVEALRAQIMVNADEDQSLPNRIEFFMHPENTAAWHSHPEWLSWLTQAIQGSASEAGVDFYGPLDIQIKEDGRLSKSAVNVDVKFNQEESDLTTALAGLNAPQNNLPEPGIFHCYLLVNGQDYYQLEETVINLGRREDNQVILPDLRVSRSHAQLRKIHGRYILFDLNSTGGTFVNGNRITQHALQTGDVISLAGVSIIYGEEIQRDDLRGGTTPTDYT